MPRQEVIAAASLHGLEGRPYGELPAVRNSGCSSPWPSAAPPRCSSSTSRLRRSRRRSAARDVGADPALPGARLRHSLTTHYLAEAERPGRPRIIVIDKGSVIADGPPTHQAARRRQTRALRDAHSYRRRPRHDRLSSACTPVSRRPPARRDEPRVASRDRHQRQRRASFRQLGHRRSPRSVPLEVTGAQLEDAFLAMTTH